MPAKRKAKLGDGNAAFANSLLEALARSSGAGWFNARQQSRLRLLIREEFSDLESEGLLFNDEHLDLLEIQEEQENYPDGDRPDLYADAPPEDEPTIEAEVVIPSSTPEHKVMVIPC